MKKILLGLACLLSTCNPFAFGNTQIASKDVTVSPSAFINCLGISDTNVQLSLNDIDACFGGLEPTISFNDSLVNLSSVVTLVNDSLSPGNTQYYGTNSSGTKGFFSVPSLYWSASGANIYNTNAGNVGIGSLSPGQTLDVTGSGRFSGNLSNSNSGGTILQAKSLGAGTTRLLDDGLGNNSFYIGRNSVTTLGASNLIIEGNSNGGGVFQAGQLNTLIGFASGNTLSTGSNNTFLGSNADAGSSNLSNATAIGSNAVVNSSNSLVLGSSVNVGIGSSAPGQTLDVIGTIRTTSFQLTNNPTSGYVLTANSVGIGTWQPSAGSGNVNSGTMNQIGYYSSTGQQISGATNFVYTGTNVGIGTLAPDRILDIVSSDTNTTLTTPSLASMGIKNLNNATSNNFADMAFSTTDTNGSIQLGSKISGVFTSHAPGAVSGGIAFLNKTAGITTEVMRIVGGNVGIGTTSPQANFENHGTFNNFGSPNGNTGVNTFTPGQTLDVNGTARMTGFILSTSPINGGVLFSDSSGKGTWRNFSTGWTVNDNDVYETNGGNVGIGTNFTQNSALTVMNGNVGIGTWGPTERVEVKTGNLKLDVGTIVVGATSASSISTTTKIYGGSFTTTASNVFMGLNGTSGSGADTGIFFPTRDMVAFSNKGTESMRIDNNGNVGIGTNIPIGGLDVEGTVNSIIFFGNIISNQNVGIGSSMPGQKLDVQGTVRSSLGFSSGSNSFYYCNSGVDLGVLSRGSSCLCPGGSCIATNISSN